MDLEIFWTDFAKNELHNIFNFYKENAGITVAKKLVVGITKETLKLKKYPNIGQRELILQNDDRDFYYLVFKKYKIIYGINHKSNRIEILDVFDSRQNPVHLKRVK